MNVDLLIGSTDPKVIARIFHKLWAPPQCAMIVSGVWPIVILKFAKEVRAQPTVRSQC